MHREFILTISVRWPVALEIRVLPDLGDRFSDYSGDILVANEQQYRRLGVAPNQVAEQLLVCLIHRFLAVPDFALTDEDVAVVNADEYVGLASSVEEFAAGFAFELAVESDEEHIADLFLFQLGGKRRGCSSAIA